MGSVDPTADVVLDLVEVRVHRLMTVVLMAVLFGARPSEEHVELVHVVLMAREPATVDIEVARGDGGSVAPEAGERANGIGGERWHDTSWKGVGVA